MSTLNVRNITGVVGSINTTGTIVASNIVMGAANSYSLFPQRFYSVFQINGVDASNTAYSTIRWSGDTGGSSVFFGKSRGTTIGNNSVVLDGDTLGGIQALSANGNGHFLQSGIVRFESDGGSSATSSPGKITFFTTPSGSSGSLERMKISANGDVHIHSNVLASNVIVNGVTLNPNPNIDENKIINGNFEIWQRGTSSATGGYQTADRWYNLFSGGTCTLSRQSFTVGDALGKNSPKYFARMAVSGQSGSNYSIMEQRIEDVRSYAEQNITILGWAKRSSGTGNLEVTWYQDFGTGGSPSSQVYGVGQLVTLTGSWAPFAVTFSISSIAGKTLGSNNDHKFVPRFVFSNGPGSLGIQTINVDLWGLHIRVGTYTTTACDAYIAPDFATEWQRCQRYYQIISHASGAGNATSASQGFPTVYTFPTKMRATPSMSTSAFSVTNASMSSGSTTDSVYTLVATSSGAGIMSWSNSTTPAIVADAEI